MSLISDAMAALLAKNITVSSNTQALRVVAPKLGSAMMPSNICYVYSSLASNPGTTLRAGARQFVGMGQSLLANTLEGTKFAGVVPQVANSLMSSFVGSGLLSALQNRRNAPLKYYTDIWFEIPSSEGEYVPTVKWRLPINPQELKVEFTPVMNAFRTIRDGEFSWIDTPGLVKISWNGVLTFDKQETIVKELQEFKDCTAWISFFTNWIKSKQFYRLHIKRQYPSNDRFNGVTFQSLKDNITNVTTVMANRIEKLSMDLQDYARGTTNTLATPYEEVIPIHEDDFVMNVYPTLFDYTEKGGEVGSFYYSLVLTEFRKCQFQELENAADYRTRPPIYDYDVFVGNIVHLLNNRLYAAPDLNAGPYVNYMPALDDKFEVLEIIEGLNSPDGIQWIRLKGTKYVVKFESDADLEVEKVYYVGGARVTKNEYEAQVRTNTNVRDLLSLSTALSVDIVEAIRGVKPTGYTSMRISIVSDGTFWARQGDFIAQDPAVIDYYRKFDEKVAKQTSSKKGTKTKSGKTEKTDVTNKKSGIVKTQEIYIPFDVKVNPNAAEQNTSSNVESKKDSTVQKVGMSITDPEYNQVLAVVRQNYPDFENYLSQLLNI